MLVADRSFKGILGRDIDEYPEGIVIPVDKPYRWTSADVIRKIKYAAVRHFGKKCGLHPTKKFMFALLHFTVAVAHPQSSCGGQQHADETAYHSQSFS